jgi:uncharacterized protein
MNITQVDESAQYPAWIRIQTDGVILNLVIQPKSSRTETVGPHGEPPRLKVRVAAPPVDGEANAELLRFLKKALRVTSTQLRIVRGESSRQKDILCSGVDAAQVIAALAT